MKIEKDSAVTIRIKFKDAAGKLLGASDQPVAYLHGG